MTMAKLRVGGKLPVRVRGACGRGRASFSIQRQHRHDRAASHCQIRISTMHAVDDSLPSVGIIGMGEMGRMYAKYLNDAGRRRSALPAAREPPHRKRLRMRARTVYVQEPLLMSPGRVSFRYPISLPVPVLPLPLRAHLASGCTSATARKSSSSCNKTTKVTRPR